MSERLKTRTELVHRIDLEKLLKDELSLDDNERISGIENRLAGTYEFHMTKVVKKEVEHV